MTHRRHRRDEQGYVAVLTAVLLIPLLGMAAFAVDVGQWYVTAREAQRAADAGALAGVTRLPGDPQGAFATAKDFAGRNGFVDAEEDSEVTARLENGPTKLRVTVSKTAPTTFGRLFGVTDTTITRSAVADYAGPVPLGSPCNKYGNDPDPGDTDSSVCDDVGQFWANVGSPGASKRSGDAFQNGSCSGEDQCAGGTNTDYDPNGYFYSVTLSQPVDNLVIEAFDPALIHVGDRCEASSLDGAADLGRSAAPRVNASDRYSHDPAGPYCTGDIDFGKVGKGYQHQVATSFTVRDPGASAWDPLSYPARTDCVGTGSYPGYNGVLSEALNTTHASYGRRPNASPDLVDVASRDGYVASVFRRWVPLCTIARAEAGTYLVQVKTNGLGADEASGHNRFALRAFSTTQPEAKELISISGFAKMAMYANLPDADTRFYLARVPSGAAGQILNVQLFDVGDSTRPGTIRVLAPPDSGVTFTDCRGVGVRNGVLSDCALNGVRSTYNGKWQIISVPIPVAYRCDDLDPTDCWVRLQYDYGDGNQPSDTTSWGANIEGDPVRLIE